LDEASCDEGLASSDCHFRRSQNSHKPTRDYQKFYSGGFSTTEEEVDGEQKEGDVDACDQTQSAAMHNVGHNAP
jgi:hypothetical protein